MPKVPTASKSKASNNMRSQNLSRRRPARCLQPPPPPMTDEEVSKLRGLMREQLEGKEPRDFQVEMVKCQQERRDALCHVATGMGKTAVAAGPYALPENKGKVTLMVSPLIGLQNDSARSFMNEFGVSAIAVNSAAGSQYNDNLKEILDGSYRIILLSPEMLLGQRFMKDVLKNSSFSSRIYSVIIDEAHCISHWGADFRKRYGQIGSIRSILPRNTPFIALSASLTWRVTQDIIRTLQLDRSNFLHLNLGNDRPTVSLIVRAIHNTMASFTDLDFVIPNSVKIKHDIPKTWIYVDNINVGAEIIDHLRTLLPSSMHGAIRPYNSVLHTDYRDEAMRCFKEGDIRILVCTDAAGMGCNIPDIDIVVQWKLPGKLSNFVQRAGRVARGPGRTGLAVLLAEPAAFSVLLSENQPEVLVDKERKPRAGRGRKSGGLKKADKAEKNYARNRGRFRGNLNCLDAFDPLPQEPSVGDSDPTEGIYHFIQTTQCRRHVITDVFGNPDTAPTVPCCDICSPSLLDLVRPGKKPNTDRMMRVAFQKEENKALYHRIKDWRGEIYKRDYKNSLLLAENVLPDEAISKLAHLKPPISAAAIRSVLVDVWPLWDWHGEELMQQILTMPSLQPSMPAQQQDPDPSPPAQQLSMPTRQQDLDPSSPVSQLSAPAQQLSIPTQQQDPDPPSPASQLSAPVRQQDLVPSAPTPPPSAPAQPQHLTPLHTASNTSRPHARLVLPLTPARRQEPTPWSMPTPPNLSHPSTPHLAFLGPPRPSFSPVVMYHHPLQARPLTGPPSFGGSFSYQDLANMATASASLQHQYSPSMFRQPALAWPPSATSFTYPTQGPPPS